MAKIKRPLRDVMASVLFSVLLFLFIFAFSIALPIYFRPFYYMHIEPLELEALSGFSEVEIKDAFNEVMDYLTLPGYEFGTGVMNYSESGAAHFADCKALFNLNAGVLLGTGLGLAVLTILRKLKKIGELRIGSMFAGFYSGVAAIIFPIVLGVLVSLNTSKAFRIFHAIFFPGKDNWALDWQTDEIILVLPMQFFINCGILIGASVLVFSMTLIMIVVCRRAVQRKRNNTSSKG